jgi:uncharacterized protein
VLAVTLALSVLIGVSLGLLGGGGSILTVPILVYVAGQDPKAAIATSLLVVAVTSAAAAIPHARAGRVRWRTALIFGAAGMAGAYGGGRLGTHIDGTILLIAFGLMMAATAVAMLQGKSPVAAAKPHAELPIPKVLIEGAVVGVVTGLVGAGGGFLVVPALALLGGLPMSVAVGTSLVVIAMKSSAGLFGYLQGVAIDWPLAVGVTLAAVVGSVIGARLVDRISQDQLRKGFGWFVVVMAVFVLGRELPGDVVLHPATLTLGGALVVAGVVSGVLRRRVSPENEWRPDDAVRAVEPVGRGTHA